MNETEKQLPPLDIKLLMLFKQTDQEGDYILDEILEITDGYMNLKCLADWYSLPDYWVQV